MNTIVQGIMVVTGLSLVIFVWQMIKQDHLRPRYALLWMVLSFAFLIIALFRGIARWLAYLLKVDYVPSLFFGIGIIFIVIILLNLTVILSKQSKKNIELLHRSMLIHWRLEQVEKKIDESNILDQALTFSRQEIEQK